MRPWGPVSPPSVDHAYGIDAKLFEWTDEITADCPRKLVHKLDDRCRAMPGLVVSGASRMAVVGATSATPWRRRGGESQRYFRSMRECHECCRSAEVTVDVIESSIELLVDRSAGYRRRWFHDPPGIFKAAVCRE